MVKKIKKVKLSKNWFYGSLQRLSKHEIINSSQFNTKIKYLTDFLTFPKLVPSTIKMQRLLREERLAIFKSHLYSIQRRSTSPPMLS